MRQVIMLVLCGLLWLPSAWAQDITLTIPNAKFQEFKEAVLTASPIPDADHNGQPDFTENQWVRKVILAEVLDVYRTGRLQQAQAAAAPVIDVDIVQ